MRPAFLFACLVGCGRVGFDDHPTGDGGLSIDARPDASFTSRHWVDRANNTPGTLYAPKLVYHPGRRTVIMYGGDKPGSASDEMWEWDGTTWTRLCAGCAPGGRRYHSMTYDSGRDRIVLFGGRPGGVDLNDLWEWDGTTWTERTPAGPIPSGREGSQLGYDPDRQRVVLMGGCAGRRDVWEWDGTAWTNPTPANAPMALGGHGSEIAYDRANHRLLVLPDPCNETTRRDDLYAWDGTSWTMLCGSCSGVPRVDASIVYDVALAKMYLVGGFDGGEIRGTSVLVADEWQPLEVDPSARDSVGIAYDESRDVIVLYGGNGAPCGGDCDETWEMVPD